MDTSTKLASVLALPAAALLLAGCATHDSDVQLPIDVTNALEMAFNKGDVQACADLYTDDAEIISDHNNSVVGRKAIGEFFKQQVNTDLLFDTDSKISVVCRGKRRAHKGLGWRYSTDDSCHHMS